MEDFIYYYIFSICNLSWTVLLIAYTTINRPDWENLLSSVRQKKVYNIVCTNSFTLKKSSYKMSEYDMAHQLRRLFWNTFIKYTFLLIIILSINIGGLFIVKEEWSLFVFVFILLSVIVVSSEHLGRHFLEIKTTKCDMSDFEDIYYDAMSFFYPEYNV